MDMTHNVRNVLTPSNVYLQIVMLWTTNILSNQDDFKVTVPEN